MTAKPERNQLSLPQGLTPEEEACWWDEHPEYWDDLDTDFEVIEGLQVRATQEVKLFLPVDMVTAVKELAAREQRTYQSVLREWVDAGFGAAGLALPEPAS